MNKKKIINIATAMFVLVIFTIAVAPQILAQEITIKQAQNKVVKVEDEFVTISSLKIEIIDEEKKEIVNEILDPNKTYRLDYYFTASHDLEIVNVESELKTLVTYETSEKEYSKNVYVSKQENLQKNNLKVKKERNNGFEEYIFVETYFLDKYFFEEIKNNLLNLENEIEKEYQLNNEFSFMKKTTLYVNNGNDKISLSNIFIPIKINFLNSKITSKQTAILKTNKENIAEKEAPVSSKEVVVSTLITSEDSSLLYSVNIPCAIDMTQIIIPMRSAQDKIQQLKEKCISTAYFNPNTKTHHLKANEGYYFEIKIDKNPRTNKDYEIEKITLNFYNEYTGNLCFSKVLIKDNENHNLYLAKISKSSSLIEENMADFSNSCKFDNSLLIRTTVTTKDNENIDIQNIGEIIKVRIDENFVNILTEETEKDREKRLKELGRLEIKEENAFLTTENSMKKIEPIENAFKENNIKEKKIVSDVVLEVVNDTPAYIFEIKETKKIFGFIPYGNKVVKKIIPAIKNINE